MSGMEPAGSAERIAETAETLSWLTDLVQTGSDGGSNSHAKMVDVLSLARSYVVEFAVHRSLGASDLEAAEVKLTRFRGHLILNGEGVRNAHTEAAVSDGVPPADG